MLKIFKITFLILIIFFFKPFSVFASSEAIQSFNSKIVAHKDGSFNVTENIVYDFGDNSKHGIYRDIPKISTVGDLYRIIEISDINVLRDRLGERYSISDSSKQISVKIGNPDKTITGVHTYTISYLVKNGVGSNYEDHDEIYWNVTGNEWAVPIMSASSLITTDFGGLANKWICYSGPSGSRDQNCTTSNINSPIKTTTPLNPEESLTIALSFPVNTFPKSILVKSLPQNTTPQTDMDPFVTKLIGFLFFAVPIFLNLILAPGLLLWYFKNKRKQRFGPVSVNFDLPKDPFGKRITPAEAGTVDNTLLDQNDVVATIFDWAIRKYIRIEQVKSEKVLGILGGGDDFKLVASKELDDKSSFEKSLWSSLFERNSKSTMISFHKDDFYKTFDILKNKIFEILVERGFYSKNPITQRGLLLAGAIIALVTLNLLLGGVMIFFYKKLNGRTALGDEMDWKIDGLKIFLKNMSREYKWQADNLITVEKYIPYAMSLGYIKEFMEQLKIIYPNYQPNWYTGNLAFYSMQSSLISSMNSNFTTHAPASSSGFSGGGSSGGGGGGGGGGSW